jgi:hypothetical protein
VSTLCNEGNKQYELAAHRIETLDCKCGRIVPSVSCIVGLTEILIVINIVCEVGKVVELQNSVILLVPVWYCTPLGCVI